MSWLQRHAWKMHTVMYREHLGFRSSSASGLSRLIARVVGLSVTRVRAVDFTATEIVAILVAGFHGTIACSDPPVPSTSKFPNRSSPHQQPAGTLSSITALGALFISFQLSPACQGHGQRHAQGPRLVCYFSGFGSLGAPGLGVHALGELAAQVGAVCLKIHTLCDCGRPAFRAFPVAVGLYHDVGTGE